MLTWAEGPTGQHLELGISEMNLFMMLGALGRSGELNDQPLLPIGTVYDPFVLRGLDAFVHGAYSGARFIVAGTPSGVTLAPEGGAHQSTITASVGIELPGVVMHEPAFAAALDWLLCDALAHVAGVDARDHPRPPRDRDRLLLPAVDAIDRPGSRSRRPGSGSAMPCCAARCSPGAYRLVDGRERLDASAVRGRRRRRDVPIVHLLGAGAVLPEVLAAARSSRTRA